MQIKHVTNAETAIGTSYRKTEKNWYEKPKEQKNDAKAH